MPRAILLCMLCCISLTSSCSRSNNLLFGTVETTAGSHRIVVTDCYRLSVDPPQEIEGPPGESGYRYTPCRDADVLIRNEAIGRATLKEEAIVNGRSYGHINAADSILVDHGVVSISAASTAARTRTTIPSAPGSDR
jgi:hypothetical protein